MHYFVVTYIFMVVASQMTAVKEQPNSVSLLYMLLLSAE